MLRPLHDTLKSSLPVWMAAALLAGCGSGSNGSADVDEGSSKAADAPPKTVSSTFDFKATNSYFVVGDPPTHARFSGGVANGNGAWVIPSGQTGVIDFATPPDTVTFSTHDNFTAAAAASSNAHKTALGRVGPQAVSPPFDVPLYVRGSVRDDWAASPHNKLTEATDNVLSLTMPLAAGDSQFKVADAGWTGATNCGAASSPTPITVGVPFVGVCDSGSQNILLTIATAGNYKFTFDVTAPDAPKFTVALDTGGGGGGGEQPKDSTEIRVFAVDALTAGAKPTLFTTVKGLGQLDVNEVKDRTGGSQRITRIEIENLGTAGSIGVQDIQWVANPRFAPVPKPVDIYYSRPSGSVEGTTITVNGAKHNCAPTTDSAFGCVAQDVPSLPFADAEMTVTNADGSSETITYNGGDGTEPIYAFSGGEVARSGTPGDPDAALPALPRNDNEVILFYKRNDNDYTGWGLHLFPKDPQGDSWTVFPTPGEYDYEGIDPVYGAYFRIVLPGKELPGNEYSNNPADLDTFPNVLGFIIHKGDEKDPGADQSLRKSEAGNMVFVVSGVNDVGSAPPGGAAAPRIVNAAMHWVNKDTLVYMGDTPAGTASSALLYSPNASIKGGLQGITGTYETIPLGPGTMPDLPHQKELLSGRPLSLPASAVARAKELARGQLVAVALDAHGNVLGGTAVQMAGALDALYAGSAYDQPLGVTYTSGAPSVAVWAPTALLNPGVTLNIYQADGTLIEHVPMTLDETSGIWRATGTAAWDRKFYTFSLRVFSPAVNAIVDNEVTDPYSVSLAMDSVRSQFVNLNDNTLKPSGWDTMVKPPLAAPEDLTIYELHVRDFSIADQTVPAGDRGKYTAFDIPGTAGRGHLEELAIAGLKAVHLLPTFDIATIPENPAKRVELGDPVEKLCTENTQATSLCATDAGKTIRQAIEDAVAANQLNRPQQIVEWMRNLDGFNWGYDPFHYGVPEGSYSTDANGPQRIYEFRRMVKGLNDLGLRTIIDVVYNHTNASGQNGKSVLDRIVPGYYHRRNEITGNVLHDSCCEDTAAEFRMFEKLMIDTGVTWARDYKVSGYRFDIMTFHPLDVMQRFRSAVLAYDPKIYIYGEGWNFGAVQDDKRFLTSRQANLGGTGIGSFSDRIRDPIRGGGPFDSAANYVKNQGLISGQYYAPNNVNSGGADEKEGLLNGSDNIRLWMAGGGETYRLQNAAGETVAGTKIDYGGQESGYTQDPQEAINYISKHDNESLWDISQYKHDPATSLADRVRADGVGMSLILLGEGIPFFQAGTEILRSKSMDRNSYDSGDWYNEIDWTLQTSKWNQGLPSARDNSTSYAQILDVMQNTNAVEDYAARQAAFERFKELLELRTSSKLFRLQTQAQIDQRVSFYNTGPFQVPGVIAMRIDGCTEPGFAPSEGAIMVIANATTASRTLNLFSNETWTLHPILASSFDPVVKTAAHGANGFTVPARTTAVFVRASQTSCAPYPRDLFVRGSFTGPTPTEPYKLQFLGGTGYSVSVPVTAGAQYFKIADAGYVADTNCGGVVANQLVELGKPSLLACNSTSPNLVMPATTAAGNYTFALDASNLVNPTLTVSRVAPFAVDLFVRGEMNSWANPPPESARMTYDGVGGYRVVLSGLAAAPYNFKIADAGWGNSNDGASNCGAGAGGSTVTVGQPYAMSCSNTSGNMSISLPGAGSYVFSADFANATPQLTVSRSAFNVAVFLRGSFNGWADPPPDNARMFETGGGQLRRTLRLVPGAEAFKVADASWNVFNCGGGQVTLGAPVALTCGGSSPNTSFAVPAEGYYSFTLDASNPAAPSVTVKGP